MGLSKENKCCGTCAAWGGKRCPLGNNINSRQVDIQSQLGECAIKGGPSRFANGCCDRWAPCIYVM